MQVVEEQAKVMILDIAGVPVVDSADDGKKKNSIVNLDYRCGKLPDGRLMAGHRLPDMPRCRYQWRAPR